MYYFGGMLFNTTGTYAIYRQQYFFDAKDFVDYQFGNGRAYYNCVYRGECPYSDYFVHDDRSFRINGDGIGSFRYVFGDPVDKISAKGLDPVAVAAPDQAEKIYAFAVTVQDPETSRTVTKTISTLVHTTDAYVGIKVPYRTASQEDVRVQGIVLDRDARPVDDRTVTLELIKVTTQRVKKQGVDGIFYYDYETKETVVDVETVVSDGQGKFEESLSPDTDGDYRVVARYT